MKITCPSCSARLTAKPGHADKRLPCPKCHAPILIPAERVERLPVEEQHQQTGTLSINVHVVSPFGWLRSIGRKSKAAAVMVVLFIGLSGYAVFSAMRPAGPKVVSTGSTPQTAGADQQTQTLEEVVLQAKETEWLPDFETISKQASLLHLWNLGTERSALRGRPLQVTHFGPDATRPLLSFDVYQDESGRVRGVLTRYYENLYWTIQREGGDSDTLIDQIAAGFASVQDAMLRAIIGEPVKWSQKYQVDPTQTGQVQKSIGKNARVLKAEFTQGICHIEVSEYVLDTAQAKSQSLMTLVIVRDLFW